MKVSGKMNEAIGKVSSTNIMTRSQTLKASNITKHKRKTIGKKGVVYLSHIPHGFYEGQIKRYFQQFGNITNLSVPRSKTGRAKGFAFIEFKHQEVAEIAAETMNNYLMFNRLLKAKYIPPKQQKPQYFATARKAKETHSTIPEKAENAIKQNRSIKNRHLNEDAEALMTVKLLKKQQAISRNLEKLGVDYKFQVQKGEYEPLLKKGKEILKMRRQDMMKEKKKGEKEILKMKRQDIMKKKKEKGKKEKKKLSSVSEIIREEPCVDDEDVSPWPVNIEPEEVKKAWQVPNNKNKVKKNTPKKKNVLPPSTKSRKEKSINNADESIKTTTKNKVEKKQVKMS